jgi:putative hydrolase of the HAD superfamily
MSRIEGLVFDLGGVIVAHDNPVMFDALRDRCAPGAGPRLQSLLREDRWGEGAPLTDLHGLLRAELGYDGDWDRFLGDWCCHFRLDMAMLDYVERLAARRRVMILSNTNAGHWDYLTAASGGRLARFEAYLSHEIGVLKPRPEAYLVAARRAGLTPERLLFFDDLETNVAGARAAGLEAELFTSQAELERSLRRRGLA